MQAEAVCPTYTKPCTRTGPGYPECPDPDYLNKGKHRWEQNTDEISFDISAEDYDGYGEATGLPLSLASPRSLTS